MASPANADTTNDAGAKLAVAVQQLQLQPRPSFHDGFLDALRAPFAAADGSSAWRRTALQHFLVRFFPAYEAPSSFAALWTLLVSDCDRIEEDTLVVRFETLRSALQRHTHARWLTKDAFPLEREQLLYVTPTDELTLELKLPSPALSTRASLPSALTSSPPPVPSRQSIGAVSTTSSSPSSSPSSTTGTPLLRDFRADVLKKSRRWLGRWQTRFLFLRWDELEICKKNVSAGAVQSPSAAHTNAKSKRYPLHTLLSLQLVPLSETEASKSKKQALSLHFTHSVGSGHTTKTLTLGSDRSDQLQAVVSQLATFALLAGLARGQDAPSLRKFLVAGANLDVYCVVPPPLGLPSMPLSPLQLAFLQADDAAVGLLVRAGADPRSVLHWAFATHVLFPSVRGDSDTSRARGDRQLALLVSESIDGVVFPFGSVVADDAAQWSLLMYLSAVGELEAARTLLATLRRLSPTKCRQYVDHVNAAGDNALHVAIKAAATTTTPAARASEELAMLIVDVGTNRVTPLSSLPSSASSLSLVDSQLLHCCDGHGESVFHLALKGRLWRLVDKLVDCKAVDPTAIDRDGNTSLHMAIAVGAPVAVVARLVQLYRPSALNSRTSSSLGTSFRGLECRDRCGNDTPLTLALKRRQQEVVALLLAANASPNVGSDWSSSLEPTTLSLSPAAVGGIRDGDAPLHVAIKSGLALAAASLVAYSADLLAEDANGASALALAIRFGMYALSATIAAKLAVVSDSGDRTRALDQWMDNETGTPVTLLAVRAGQMELVAVLLDLCEDQVHLSHATTNETLLHVLVKHVCWLEWSRDAVGSRRNDNDAGESDRQQFYRDMRAPAKRQRHRLKSRSEGDLPHWRLAPSYSSQTLTTATAPPIEANKAAAAVSELSVAFFHDALEALVCGVLQRLNDAALVSAASTAPHHSPPHVVTDQNSDGYTVLHAAAAGGDATSRVLSLLLAFLFLRGLSPSHLEVAQALATTTGPSAEMPLHAALASNSPANALLILFAVRVVSGSQRLAPLTRDSVGQHTPATTATTAQATALCAQVVEGATVRTGCTPLHLACQWPRSAAMLRVVELLLDEGAYAGSWDADGLMPLHVALQHTCDERVIRLFQRYGQDLNVWTEGAATADDTSDLDAEDKDEKQHEATPKTALMLALEHENAAAWRELVRCGAQVRVVTPTTRLGLLHVAVECRVRDKELLEALLGCRQLVAHNVTDCYGRTTADVVEILEAQLQLVDEQLSVTLSDGASVAGLVGRRTSAVLEEQDNDVASDSVSTQRITADTVGSSSSSAQELPTTVSPSDTLLSRDTSRRMSSGILFFDAGPATRQQPLPSTPNSGSDADAIAASRRLATSAVGGLSRASLGTARGLQGLPRAPSLDTAVIAFLREEERATLTLLAHEARQEATDWLQKRIGQKKLLSDARAQLQSAQSHRRTGSGSIPVPTNGLKAADGSDSPAFSHESERQLAQFKALAAKKFVDKHVAEVVAEARMDIEREKQAICQDTGVYPGRSTTKTTVAAAGGGSRRTRSITGHQRSDSNATLLSAASVWWSERGGTSFDDPTGTWLSTGGGGTMLSDSWNGTWLSSLRGTGVEYRDSHVSSSTFHSFLEVAEPSEPYAVIARRGGSEPRNDDEGDEDDEDWDDDVDYTNPLDRDSFSRVIATRKSLS